MGKLGDGCERERERVLSSDIAVESIPLMQQVEQVEQGQKLANLANVAALQPVRLEKLADDSLQHHELACPGWQLVVDSQQRTRTSVVSRLLTAIIGTSSRAHNRTIGVGPELVLQPTGSKI